MDLVKWPHSIGKAFQDQFSDLPKDVFGRLVMHVNSAAERSDRPSSFPLLFTMEFDDTVYTVSLKIEYAREGKDRVITRFTGTVYTS